MARASTFLDGAIFHRRRSLTPCICIQQKNENGDDNWEWVNIHELTTEQFEKYKISISNEIARIQREVYKPEKKIIKWIYEPSPDEYQLMKQLFYNVPPKIQRRLMIEYSHTVLGKNVCPQCSTFEPQKKKCIHFACPGMCSDCFEKMGDMCPICEKEQKIECPICRETKERDRICILKHCRHPICNKCFTKSAQANKIIDRCPTCRNPEIF